MNENYKLKHSLLTGKNYDILKTVKILNIAQAAAYLENDIFPVDICVSKDNNGKRCLVYYFDKDESKEVYDKWCKYEL